MRKFLMSLISGMGIACATLTGQSDQLEQKVQEALSTLDQSQCPSGRLLDRVPKYYPLEYWRGNYLSDSTSFLISRFSLLHGMLRAMDVDQNSNIPKMNTILLEAQKNQSSDTVRLGLIFYHYDRLKDSALTHHLISYQNGHFYDVPGRTEIPYHPDTLFAFSAFTHQKHQLHQNFILPSGFITSSMNHSSIEIDFDDGLGYRIIDNDSLIEIHYPDYGIKRLKCRLVDHNDRVYLAQTILEITPKIGGLVYNTNADDSVNLSGVKVFWWYNQNCPDRKIRKPLILIEGFDPLNTLGPKLVFEEYGKGNSGLLSSIYQDPFNILLSEYLHDDDYDVFYIDYKQGHIRIQDNANYAIEAIKWINERKHRDGSRESNVVIGASMGGVVGYYALRKMELESIDHETELYLSVDSPLKGANILVGMQAFVQELGDYKLVGTRLKNFGNKDVFAPNGNGLLKGQFALNSPAAKQMLYYHYDSPAWQECNGIDGDCKKIVASQMGTEHDAFYSEFESLGKLDIPHYGISNGSVKRKEQQFGPAAKLADAYLTTDELLDQGGFGDFWSDATEILVSLSYHSGFNSKHIINALGDQNSVMVYYGGFSTTILFIPIVKIVERHVSGARPFDSAPGGMRKFESGLKWKHESFCFIPTMSSLRLDTEDPYYQDISTVEDAKQTVLEGRSKLSYYSGSIEQKPFFEKGSLFWNEDHVSLNKRLAEYLRLIAGYNIVQINNPLNNASFNFGTNVPSSEDLKLNIKTRIRNVINYDLDIYGEGNLWINKLNRIGYIHNTQNPWNGSLKPYELNIIQDCLDTTLVVVRNGGIVLVGDESNHRKAKLQLNDSTRLHIQEGGFVKIESECGLNINSGAVLTLSKNGKLQAGFESKILIRNEGVLRIEGKGILNLTDNAEVIIEENGTLIIEPGAIFRFQDGPQDMDGRCRILVKKGGRLIYNGPWKHEGNGYIQFDRDHILELSQDFGVRGIQKGIRFMRLNEGCKLKIEPNKNLILGLGKIEYEPSSAIVLEGAHQEVSLDSLTAQGTVNFVAAYANGSTAILSSCKSIFVNFCDFYQIQTGIRQVALNGKFGTSHGEKLVMKKSTSYDVQYPFILVGMRLVALDSVVLNQGIYSELKECLRSELKNTRVLNMSQAGLRFSKSKYLIIYNSLFANNNTGIMGSDQSNVFCYETQFTANKLMGIKMEGDSENGMVELGCCSFQKNPVCVGGKDILFSLDPISVNPMLGSFGLPGNNRFILTQSQKYFDVQYTVRYMDEVDAKYNYWGGSEPAPADYVLKYFSRDIPLNFEPFHRSLIQCQSQVPPNHSDPCPLTGNESGQTFHQILGSAMHDFHLAENASAENKMKEISNMQDLNYWNAGPDCRFSFDYARVFTRVATPPMQSPVISGAEQVYESASQLVAPNPFSDYLMLNDLPNANARLRVVNLYGTEMFSLNQLNCNGSIHISTGNWPNGVYLVEWVDKNGVNRKIKTIKVN